MSITKAHGQAHPTCTTQGPQGGKGNSHEPLCLVLIAPNTLTVMRAVECLQEGLISGAESTELNHQIMNKVVSSACTAEHQKLEKFTSSAFTFRMSWGRCPRLQDKVEAPGRRAVRLVQAVCEAPARAAHVQVVSRPRCINPRSIPTGTTQVHTHWQFPDSMTQVRSLSVLLDSTSQVRKP